MLHGSLTPCRVNSIRGSERDVNGNAEVPTSVSMYLVVLVRILNYSWIKVNRTRDVRLADKGITDNKERESCTVVQLYCMVKGEWF